MLLGLLILPHVPVSDHQLTWVEHLLDTSFRTTNTESFHKLAPFDTWKCTHIRYMFPSPSNIGQINKNKEYLYRLWSIKLMIYSILDHKLYKRSATLKSSTGQHECVIRTRLGACNSIFINNTSWKCLTITCRREKDSRNPTQQNQEIRQTGKVMPT